MVSRHKGLKLSTREAEGVEDGMLWGLGCLDGVLASPVRAWLTAHRDDLSHLSTNPSSETLLSRLSLNKALPRGFLGSLQNSSPAQSALEVARNLIALSGKASPLWWAGTSKPAHMVALILGLSPAFTPAAGAQIPLQADGRLLSNGEAGYALALIAEFTGHEPKAALRVLEGKVLESYLGGRSHLHRDLALRHDLHALTTEYDRAKIT